MGNTIHTECKECGTCGILKPFTDFYTDSRSGDGLRSSCKPCVRQREKIYARRPSAIKKKKIRNKRYMETDGERIREVKRAWYQNKKQDDNFREEKATYMKKWRIDNRSKHNENSRVHFRQAINDLKDPYVRKILKATGVESDFITPELIEYKRLQIQLKRKLKAIKNGTSKVSTQH